MCYCNDIKRTDMIAKEVGAQTIVITPFNYLFHYQNEKENDKILLQCVRMIKELSDTYDVTLDGSTNFK
jgi:hypothetical protein